MTAAVDSPDITLTLLFIDYIKNWHLNVAHWQLKNCIFMAWE